MTEWRRASASGALAGLAGTPRAVKRSPDQLALERLRQRNERLERELAKTEAALVIMGKARAFGVALRELGHRPAVEAVIDAALGELAPVLGVKPACALVGRPRATHYRSQQALVERAGGPQPGPANALSGAERERVLAVLRAP
ncbi:MAG TPA: hypothetical protein VGN54_11675 [Mycobacteriales bacterium]|nr:hypothetical protein [Mycobacteriales bacterium]